MGPLRLPRANILRAQCRYGRKHGGRHQEQKADDLFHDTNCCSVIQATAVGNNGDDDKSNLDQAILQGNGHTDPEKFPHHRTPWL